MATHSILSKIVISISASLLVLSGTNNLSFAVSVTRDIKTNPVYIQDNFKDADISSSKREVDYVKKFSPYSTSTTKLHGGVSELISIVGKSQLIRFDEPVERISIANPAYADIVILSKKEVLLNGKAQGVTSLIVWGKIGDPVFFDLNVKTDTTTFLNALKEVGPNEDIDIKFTPATGSGGQGGQGGQGQQSEADTNAVFSGKISSSIIRDQFRSLAQAYGFNFIDLTETTTPQVMLEIKVAEANRALTRNSTVNLVQGGKIRNPFGSHVLTAPFKYLEVSGSAAPGISLSNIFLPIINSTASISLNDEKGLIKVLAEPKLMTLNKQEASFNAGQQVPVPTGVDAQSGQITYEYKDVGVNLRFTPDILEQSRKIVLKLNPEVNEIDTTITVRQPNGIVIYGIRTRRVDTTVELNDGETLVIAGLLKRTNNESSYQVPFLGDIPILGNLFASKEFQKGETELLIFVTPRIIKSDNLVNGV